MYPYQNMENYIFPTMEYVSSAEIELFIHMRLLWNEHISWTRMTISSLVFHLPSADAVTKRLLKNADQMGDALKYFYGEQIGKMYGNLIIEHLVIAADLVKAVVAGDQTTAAVKDKEWYKNADDISTFLNRINPYIGFKEMQDLFYTHLDQTKQETTQMINGQYEQDIATYDQMQIHGQEIADTLTEAIIKQMPQRFMYNRMY